MSAYIILFSATLIIKYKKHTLESSYYAPMGKPIYVVGVKMGRLESIPNQPEIRTTQKSSKCSAHNQRIRDIDRALDSGKLYRATISPQQRQQLTSTKQQLENLSQNAKNLAALNARLNEVQNKLRTETLEQKLR